MKEAERADALKVAAKLREMKLAPGVQSLEQCNLPLADRKLKPADLMQEVKLVPNGWIALGAYQQQGYAYIAPCRGGALAGEHAAGKASGDAGAQTGSGASDSQVMRQPPSMRPSAP